MNKMSAKVRDAEGGDTSVVVQMRSEMLYKQGLKIKSKVDNKIG